jgi:DUF971 family protein
MKVFMNEVIPTGLAANKKAKVLSITWNDKHLSTYPLALLRHACPCAQCRGGHEHMSDEPAQEVFYIPDEDNPGTRLASIENVGSYGLTITWEDGHHYGIYNWHYLRALCPCPICREMTIYGK